MTYPEIVDTPSSPEGWPQVRGDRRLKCPGCKEPLGRVPWITISDDAEMRFAWLCRRCGKTTELIVDLREEAAWTVDGVLMPTIPSE